MSAMGVAATDTPRAAERLPLVGRISGIDIARAVAIVGMVMVHIGPFPPLGGGLVGELYRIPHGRASILFIVVAGIGVSLLARGRSSRGPRSVAVRLGWRALILLPLGLALQEMDTGVAVILQYYALYFLIALAAVRWSDRILLGLAAGMSVLGPVAVLVARRSQPEWFGPIPEWSAFSRLPRDLVLSGTYPALVWVVPLLIGIWLGRQDLRSALVSVRLLLGGAVIAGAAFGLRYWLEGVAGSANARTDWLQLAAIEPHNEMPLWVLSATGIAMAVVGGATLLGRLAPLLMRPLVAMGQLALTVYVFHLLVLWQQPGWLERDAFGDAWVVIGIFLTVTLVLASVWRALAPRGPIETLFYLPWWWMDRKRRRRAAVRPIGPAELPAAAPTAP